jgi:replication factor A1
MLSEKYQLDAHKFFTCFQDAWVHEKSSCDGISVQLRHKTKNNYVFLVTQDQKVIAQLHLSQKLLKHLPEVDLTGFTPANKIERLDTTDMQIKNVSAGVKRVNLKARIVGKSLPRNVFSRFGDPLALSTATISDGTGCMKLALWNNQIDKVSIGDTVRIENGRVRMFGGELQVSVGRNGKLQVIEPVPP